MNRQQIVKEYAVYKGDSFFCLGTLEECAKLTGKKPYLLKHYTRPSHKNRKRKYPERSWFVDVVLEIKKITEVGAMEIIENRTPGLFYFEDNGLFIGIDNYWTGDCLVEEFIAEDLCTKWLNGEIQLSDLSV